jgi:Fic/DOC family
MPIQITETEYQSLLQRIASRPDGASVKELLADPAVTSPKRTLQRRLDHLLSEKLIVPVGEGRARRYRVPARLSYRTALGGTPPPIMLREDPPELPVVREWLSYEAREIRALIQAPLSERVPVGYQSGFLHAYQPNVTFYLPLPLRQELEDLGQLGLGELPAGTYIRQVMGRILIDLSWNSSRLEGNTYSLLETQRLLEFGEGAEGRAARETQMILNHKAAIEMLADDATSLDFNRYTICNLHALLSDNLLPDPSASGRIRSRPVGISGTVFHPLEVPQLVEERFLEILEKAGLIRDPFEQAFFAMVHFPYLQPFEDVNKRVSRLAANIPMIRHNLCPLSFVDVDQKEYVSALLGVYELNRVEYLRDVFAHAYRRSCARYSAVRQSLGEPDPFRMRHRSEIGRFVREVVTRRMEKRTASRWIATEAAGMISESELARFIEVVETELGCLHEGNIARFRLRPLEFAEWARGWR